MMQFLLFALGFIGCLYIAACAFLYFQQDRIIFYRVATDPALAKRYEPQRVSIPSGDVAIEGWWLDKPDAESKPVVLYFGGNAEDVLWSADVDAPRLDVGRVLVTNYRGYGGTPGTPSEQALYRDALAIYDYAVGQPGVTAEKIVAVGRSLGSGVATYVAAHRPVRGVVLITPYDSIAGVAQAMYPILPIRWLVKHPFRSDLRAPSIKAPAVMLAAADDYVIPAVHTKRLYEAWGGPKQIHVLKGVGHNDINNNAEYYALLNEFLRSEL